MPRRIRTRVLQLTVFFGIAATTCAAIAYLWLHVTILSALPQNLAELRHYRPPSSCRVFSANGTPIDDFHLERRIWVPLQELPPLVQHAFLAAEDRRFLKHPGIDMLGILRAIVANLTEGARVQGGSTLTQQLVKNLIVGNERSYVRKLKEAVLAWRMERELTKAEILELYVNYIYLGSGNYGVEAAALDYFGVSARDIHAGQAALLAGLVRAPSRYSPRTAPEIAQRRRKLVLDAMLEEGYINADEAARYAQEPLTLPGASSKQQGLATAYRTQVRREIRRLLGEKLPFEQGLRIFTPLDLELQRTAEAAVQEALRDLMGRQGKLAAIRHLPPQQWATFLAQAPGLSRDERGALVPPSPGDCFQALLADKADFNALRAGSWRFALAPQEQAARVRPHIGDKATTSLAQHQHPGDILQVCLNEQRQLYLDPRPWAEGAAVVLENATGNVVALVGGYDVGLEGFIRATQARRQPGSSFKPYVYAAALLNGHNQTDVVVDAPLALPAGNGSLWRPKNYDGKFVGAVALRQALAQSINTIAVRLALEVGPAQVARMAQRLGIQSPLRHDLTIALGSNEVTLLEQVLAYATLARMGVTTSPAYIERIVDVWGHQIGAAGGPVVVSGQTVARLPGGSLGERVLPAGVAYQLADMLREVVRSGTARRAFKPGFDRAGKTGTTNEFVDAWFLGFTPRYTVGVWIGTDATFSLGDKETGGRAALPAWLKIVEALPAQENERLPLPDEAVLLPFGQQWIGLPRGAVPASLLPNTTPSPNEPLPPLRRKFFDQGL